MKSKINLIIGIVIITGTIGAFYWLWSESKNYSLDTTVDDSLKPIEIETVKNEAVTLLEGLENKAGIPISAPTGKMGKENPFK